MKKFIRIEPRKSYDKAIVRKLKSGKLVYSYENLIHVTMKLYKMNQEDAQDWVDYNILGLNDCSSSFFGVCYK